VEIQFGHSCLAANTSKGDPMNKFKIVAMDSQVAEQVRTVMKSPGYNFPAHREIAAGRAPCRHCLRLIAPQKEELILFTYDAFFGQGVAPMPGPVYVHADHCEPFTSNGKMPSEYSGQPLTLEAFGPDRKRVAERRVAGEEDAALEELLASEETEYVHVRSTSAGCYLFRVERP
jgi:hypothetical protein